MIEERSCLAVWVSDMSGCGGGPADPIIVRPAAVHVASRSPEDLQPGSAAYAGHSPLYQPCGLLAISQADVVHIPGPPLLHNTPCSTCEQTQ